MKSMTYFACMPSVLRMSLRETLGTHNVGCRTMSVAMNFRAVQHVGRKGSPVRWHGGEFRTSAGATGVGKLSDRSRLS